MNVHITLHILRLIATGEAQTIDEIAAAAAVHRATAYRILDDCRAQLGMTITWTPEHGRYSIENWGALDRHWTINAAGIQQAAQPADRSCRR